MTEIQSPETQQLPAFNNLGGLRLFGITPETQRTTQQLLDTNHEKYHIFFTKGGLHNHLVHHVLAAYSLGANPDRLKEIYEFHAADQRPKPPPQITITQENWTEHLGNPDLWTDYLNFFDEVVVNDGLDKALITYGMHRLMLPRLVSGALHPLIHVGYGIEFQEPKILAEGLAQAAVHDNRMDGILDDKYFNEPGDSNATINDILTAVREEMRFDNLRREDFKIAPLVKKAGGAIREHAHRWGIPETKEGVERRMRELYESMVLLYAATAQRPGHSAVKLDFFLMHALTSVFFVQVLLPHMSILHQIRLLRAHFTSCLAFYISRGRPQLYPDILLQPHANKVTPPPPWDANPWLEIISEAIAGPDVHVIKVIRALVFAEEKWGGGESNLFLNAAKLTVDNVKKHENWNYDGLGWDDAWE